MMQNVKAVFFGLLPQGQRVWIFGFMVKKKMPKSLFETTPKSLKLFGCLFESRLGPFCGLMSVWVISRNSQVLRPPPTYQIHACV